MIRVICLGLGRLVLKHKGSLRIRVHCSTGAATGTRVSKEDKGGEEKVVWVLGLVLLPPMFK